MAYVGKDDTYNRWVGTMAGIEGTKKAPAVKREEDILQPDSDGQYYHKDFKKLRAYCSMRDRDGALPNIMIFGGAGNGKTAAARQIGVVLGLEFYQHNAVSYPHELMGNVSPIDGSYHGTPLMYAYEHGGVVLLDENDRSENDALLPFNGGLADGYVTRPDGKRLKRHRDCLILATANTRGQGADREYVGANKLDKAYLSRYPVKIDWEHDVRLERALLGDDKVFKLVQKLRNDLRFHGIYDVEVDMRQAKSLSDAARCGIALEVAVGDIVLSGLTNDQREILDGAKKGWKDYV